MQNTIFTYLTMLSKTRLNISCVSEYVHVYLHRTTSSRAKVVEAWYRDGGVLLMGYEMYRLLSLKKSFVIGRKKKNSKLHERVIIDVDKEDHQKELMKGQFYSKK